MMMIFTNSQQSSPSLRLQVENDKDDRYKGDQRYRSSGDQVVITRNGIHVVVITSLIHDHDHRTESICVPWNVVVNAYICNCTLNLHQMLPERSSPLSNDSLLDALLCTFEKFDTLRIQYDKTRDEWRDEADVGVLTTVRRAEIIEQSLSANLDRSDETLNHLSMEIDAKIEDIQSDLHSCSERAANVSLRARIQMEVLRLVEMKVLLPEKMWHAEIELLQKLDEILIRSESSCDLTDYIALQKASFAILQRVFSSLIIEDTQS
ncbi:hypothetical protein F5879DRAFT_923898 [Lentinula edodes]|nr:hypothetical protein F5879DRAFT_923898 [Lentinula edodes]